MSRRSTEGRRPVARLTPPSTPLPAHPDPSPPTHTRRRNRSRTGRGVHSTVRKISHGLCIASGHVIHAPHTGNVVKISAPSYMARITAVGRPG